MLEVQEFYKNANLTGNPFRSNPTHENDPRMAIWVGYEKEQKQFEKFLIRSRADQIGNTNFVLLYGDYGTGKSHALLWAKHRILEVERSAYNAVCYYIQTLRKDGKISFASAFKEDIVNGSTIIQDVLKFREWVQLLIPEFKRDNGIADGTKVEEVLQRMIAAPELFNFAKDLMRADSEPSVQALLCPPKVSDYTALGNLSKIINLFVFEFRLASESRRFRKAAYLFIDELDLLSTSSAKEGRDANELIRHLYDLCPNCFCMVLGFTATAAELNIIFNEFVLSRVSKQIVLEMLDNEEAKLFVRDILNTARVNTSSPDYFPFEESAVEAVVSQIVSITPRKVITAMQQVLEEVRLSGATIGDLPVDIAYLDKHDILMDVLGA